MNRTTKSKGFGMAAMMAVLLAALLIAAIIVPAVGAIQEDAKERIVSLEHHGRLQR